MVAKKKSVRRAAVRNPGKDAPARALFTIGDASPEYGAGVVYRDKYGVRLHVWETDDDSDVPFSKERVSSYHLDVPADVLAEYGWIDPAKVAKTVDTTVADLRRRSKSRSIKDRVSVMEDLAAYTSWQSMSGGGSMTTGAAIMRQWGNTFTRTGRKTGRSPKRGAGGRFA